MHSKRKKTTPDLGHSFPGSLNFNSKNIQESLNNLPLAPLTLNERWRWILSNFIHVIQRQQRRSSFFHLFSAPLSSSFFLKLPFFPTKNIFILQAKQPEVVGVVLGVVVCFKMHFSYSHSSRMLKPILV